MNNIIQIHKNNEKYSDNKERSVQEDDYPNIIVIEKNKLNPKRMALVLKAMYEQGCRVD